MMSTQRINAPMTQTPSSFRTAEVSQIFSALRAGNSCAVVGIGSVGKSNLLRFLRRQDVWQHYYPDECTRYLAVYIDSNKLLKDTFWGLMELILHQLILATMEREIPPEISTKLNELHQKSSMPKTRKLALRFLDQALQMIRQELDLRIVFLFDEFDRLVQTMPPRAFHALRALRDEHKYRLMYVIATRLQLKYLREDISVIEAFDEIVSPQTIWIGLYTPNDADWMLKRLQARHESYLSSTLIKKILSCSGGHPGLLREIYNLMRSNPNLTIDLLVDIPQIQDECDRIWLSLSSDERTVLLGWPGETEPENSTHIVTLRQKRLLVDVPDGSLDIFSPIFNTYLQRQTNASQNENDIFINHKTREVWVHGKKTPRLAPLEFRLMQHLSTKCFEVCSRDELAQFLYDEDTNLNVGVSDNRIDTLVKRLRKKIEPVPKRPRYIKTIHGIGFKLDCTGS